MDRLESPPFSDARSNPELAGRLRDELRRFLTSTYPPWGAHQADSLDRQEAGGRLFSLLWHPSTDDLIGLALAHRRNGSLRIHGLWLQPSGCESLRRFLSDFDRHGTGSLEAITDLLPGLRPEEQPRLFEPLGFWHREKVRMRREATAVPPHRPVASELRSVVPPDLPQMTRVYASAYTERPGEFWLWESATEAAAEAEEDIGRLLDAGGRWEEGFLPDASFVWDSGGGILGFVSIHRREGGVAFVSDLVVDPRHQRRGIGRRLLERALTELTSESPQPVELSAIRFGAPYRLYRSLGFREVGPPDGRLDGHWVRGPDPTRS
jgi:GNAT superfamily N-acetyltransferase